MPEWDVCGTIKFNSNSQGKKNIRCAEQLVQIDRGHASEKCTLPVLQRQLHDVKLVFLNTSIVNNVSGMSGFCFACISIFPAHFFNHRPSRVPSYFRPAAFCGIPGSLVPDLPASGPEQMSPF